MPPRRAQPVSPAASTNGRGAVASPARSTRSTRGKKGEEESDWDGESILSGSFKVPESRYVKSNGLIGLKDTSVNVAAAFHAAQNGILPTPPSDRQTFSASRKLPSKSPQPPPATQRARSPAEQLAAAARAVSPVKYFLRPSDQSEEYTSFSSLTDGTGNGSGEISYDYQQEEEFVKAAREANRSRVSDTNKRRKKAAEEDMPYRPGEDDYQYESEDSQGEGEGVVKGGALEGRAETRGKRKDPNESYLSMGGGGIQPRQRRKARRSGEDDTDFDVNSQYARSTNADLHQTPNGYRRSPTPAQLLRALTPGRERLSPVPTFQPRRRGPPAWRTITTNVLHGIALVLRFLVNSLLAPFQLAFGSTKHIVKRARQDWWKWLSGLVALSLLLRLLDRFNGKKSYIPPNTPPESMGELVARLTAIERTLSTLSDSSNTLELADKEGRRVLDALHSRVTGVESAITSDRQNHDGTRTIEHKSLTDLQHAHEALKKDLLLVRSSIAAHDKGLASLSGKVDSFGDVSKEVKALKTRVTKVEQELKDVFEDGRIRAALERILPHQMPVRRLPDGGVDVDPIFFSEMKKVLLGRGEVEDMVRKAIGDTKMGQPGGQGWGKTEKELDTWGDRLIEQKTSMGRIVSRAEFLEVLEGELRKIREAIAELPKTSKPGAKVGTSSVTVKSSKGDDLTPVLHSLIDDAILKYSKDTIARPDYALFAAGGRVIPSITTDTLVMQDPSFLGRMILGKKLIEGNSPARALDPDNTVGRCWPFRGDQGQLGVLLSRRIVVTAVTVEHAARELAHDVSTAPRNVEVWGLVEGEENQQKAAEYLAQHPQPESSMLPSKDYLLLGTYTYDPESRSPVQTFPVEPEISDLGLNMGIVVFKVLNNWGGDFTCLYRVRVHGEILVQ
ncbi:UNC-like C-terminal-domain-containing protein [Naematelia encephala]|uniref:UNC-like C-terminal-domain-containing protein n=1 Tax=Naematelia encephala TaxID=71784 RepID=A0A1Y2AXB6_9TREE|nr:UNC-like C-terminal-domain-containing protein [Naematelia encephala]